MPGSAIFASTDQRASWIWSRRSPRSEAGTQVCVEILQPKSLVRFPSGPSPRACCGIRIRRQTALGSQPRFPAHQLARDVPLYDRSFMRGFRPAYGLRRFAVSYARTCKFPRFDTFALPRSSQPYWLHDPIMQICSDVFWEWESSAFMLHPFVQTNFGCGSDRARRLKALPQGFRSACIYARIRSLVSMNSAGVFARRGDVSANWPSFA